MSVAALPGGTLGACTRLRPLPLSVVRWCANCNNNNNNDNNIKNESNNNNSYNNNNIINSNHSNNENQNVKIRIVLIKRYFRILGTG